MHKLNPSSLKHEKKVTVRYGWLVSSKSTKADCSNEAFSAEQTLLSKPVKPFSTKATIQDKLGAIKGRDST